MKESTQGFLMGLSAAIAGVMIYVCCVYGGALFFGRGGEKSDAPQAVAEADSGNPEMVAVAAE